MIVFEGVHPGPIAATEFVYSRKEPRQLSDEVLMIIDKKFTRRNYLPNASLYHACISSSLIAVVLPDSYCTSTLSRMLSRR